MATAYSSTAQSPIFGPGNIIAGYKGQKSTASSQRPLYDSSGLLTGYAQGNDTTAQVLPSTNPADPTGKYNFSATTGLNAQGLTKGQQAVKDYQASTGLATTVKSQPIADATANALSQEKDLSNNLVKSFSDYLAEAKAMREQGKQTLATDAATYTNTPKQLESSLSDTVKNFATTAGNLDQRVTDLNAANAKTVAGNFASLEDLNNTYDAQARQVAQDAVGAAQARNNAAQSASGTPNSASGYWNQVAAKTYAQTVLPVEAQISQNRISQLTNYVTPQQRQLYADNLSQVTGLELPIAQALTQLGINNASQVAQLQSQLAGRSLSEQIQYLSSLGLPIQVAQSVAQSLPGSIAQLANIDQANNFYTLAQNYDQPLPGGLPTYQLPVPPINRPGYSNGYPVSYGQQSMPDNVNPQTEYVTAPPAPSTPLMDYQRPYWAQRPPADAPLPPLPDKPWREFAGLPGDARTGGQRHRDS